MISDTSAMQILIANAAGEIVDELDFAEYLAPDGKLRGLGRDLLLADLMRSVERAQAPGSLSS